MTGVVRGCFWAGGSSRVGSAGDVCSDQWPDLVCTKDGNEEFLVGGCFPIPVLVGWGKSPSPSPRIVTEDIFSPSLSPARGFCPRRSPRPHIDVVLWSRWTRCRRPWGAARGHCPWRAVHGRCRRRAWELHANEDAACGELHADEDTTWKSGACMEAESEGGGDSAGGSGSWGFWTLGFVNAYIYIDAVGFTWASVVDSRIRVHSSVAVRGRGDRGRGGGNHPRPRHP